MFIIPVKISNLALWLVKWALIFHLRFIYQIDICIFVAMDVNTMSLGRIKRKNTYTKILTPTDAEVVPYFSRLCKYHLHDTIYHLHLSFQLRKQHALLLVALWKPGHSGSCWRARWSTESNCNTQTPTLTQAAITVFTPEGNTKQSIRLLELRLSSTSQKINFFWKIKGLRYSKGIFNLSIRQN